MAPRLKPAEMRAWRAFLDAQASILRRLGADLVKEEDITLAEYDVLVQLSFAPDGRLRMTALSDRVRLSPSGLTRLVDRLVRSGLVKRGRCASARSGHSALLAPAGTGRSPPAAPVHRGGMREYFSKRLSPAQLAAVAEALEPLGRDMPLGVSSD